MLGIKFEILLNDVKTLVKALFSRAYLNSSNNSTLRWFHGRSNF